MSVAVIGGGGFLGLNLLDVLAQRGVFPLCIRRARGNVLGLLRRRVPMAVADVLDVEALAGALSGVQVLYHLAGHYPRNSLHPREAMARATRETEAVLNAAARAQVRRLVYISSTATVAPAVDRPSNESDRFSAPPGYGLYHDLKWRMESMIDAEHRFETITVCPAACLGRYDFKLGTSALLVALAAGREVEYPRGLVSLVAAADVGEVLARLGEHPAPPKRLILSASTYRIEALMSLLARRYGVAVPRRVLSAEEAIQFSNAEEARAEEEGGRARLAREIADLIVHGVYLDGSLASRTLGFEYQTLAETLKAFDQWALSARLIPMRQFDQREANQQ